MVRKGIGVCLAVWVLAGAARADLQFESGDDFFAEGERFTVDVYCYSAQDPPRWMGNEWCENVRVRPTDWDRLKGTADPGIEAVSLSAGKSRFSFKYDGKRGVSERFRVLDVLPDGESTFAYQLLGRKVNGRRPVVEEGTFAAHAELKIVPGVHRTYQYFAGPYDGCMWRPPASSVCSVSFPR